MNFPFLVRIARQEIATWMRRMRMSDGGDERWRSRQVENIFGDNLGNVDKRNGICAEV